MNWLLPASLGLVVVGAVLLVVAWVFGVAAEMVEEAMVK